MESLWANIKVIALEFDSLIPAENEINLTYLQLPDWCFIDNRLFYLVWLKLRVIIIVHLKEIFKPTKDQQYEKISLTAVSLIHSFISYHRLWQGFTTDGP